MSLAQKFTPRSVTDVLSADERSISAPPPESQLEASKKAREADVAAMLDNVRISFSARIDALQKAQAEDSLNTLLPVDANGNRSHHP
jgi:hypothetical protein